ncbi:MAG: TraB/GumN family protein, partial [Verrucomicrobia bacterium]
VYFVVVGVAHMGGSSGLLALLRQGGCKIEQL